MTAARPSTLAECFVWLTHNLPEKRLEELREMTRDEVWHSHFWLGPIVRENLLKDNDGLRQRLDRSAFCDDPDIAGQICDAFWDHLQIVSAQQNKQ